MSSRNTSHLRSEYEKFALSEKSALANPFAQFSRWFDDVIRAKLPEPNAMTVATVSSSGAPSARIMLLKGFDKNGFVFFTNYQSRKAGEIGKNPRAAMVFFWQGLERQVRIEGKIVKVSRLQSEIYFKVRPKMSQIGAWTSRQSRIIESRDKLLAREEQVIARFGDGPIPCPDFWGGYRLIPARFEFWQGRAGRLHDRLLYRRLGKSWKMSRLEP